MYSVQYLSHPLQNVLSEVWVAPINQLGLVELPCRTHLSHILSPGDVVWGFPLSSANLNDPNLEKMKPEAVPDVVRGGCSVERVDGGGPLSLGVQSSMSPPIVNCSCCSSCSYIFCAHTHTLTPSHPHR